MKMSPGKVALHTQIDGRLMSLAKREAMERRIPLLAVVEAALAERYDLASVVYEERGPVEIWRLR